MQAIFRALTAELLKIKRTLALALVFLAPLTLAFMELAIGFQYGKRMYRVGGDTWMTLIEHITMMWVLLLLPLFVTLEMGLLGAVEHNNKTWKLLYALPLPRWNIYAAKQIIGMGIIGLSMVVLSIMTIGVGLIGRVLLPDLGFDAPIPFMALLTNICLSFLAAWLIISIHLWVSLHWSNFVLAMGVGIVATVFGIVVIGSEWEQFDPWTLPGVVSNGLINAESYTLALSIGFLGGILAAIAGCVEVSRRDVLN
jgi:ABC-2 type transport system permease protein